jgi:magnesium transporter
LFVYDASDYTEYDDFEILSLELMSKNKLAQSPRLKRNGNYRSNRRLFKIDNFLLSDILNTSRRTKVEEFPGTLFST